MTYLQSTIKLMHNPLNPLIYHIGIIEATIMPKCAPSDDDALKYMRERDRVARIVARRVVVSTKNQQQ